MRKVGTSRRGREQAGDFLPSATPAWAGKLVSSLALSALLFMGPQTGWEMAC